MLGQDFFDWDNFYREAMKNPFGFYSLVVTNLNRRQQYFYMFEEIKRLVIQTRFYKEDINCPYPNVYALISWKSKVFGIMFVFKGDEMFVEFDLEPLIEPFDKIIKLEKGVEQ